MTRRLVDVGLVAAGVVLFTVGTLGGTAANRHHDVVETAPDQLCDRSESFFGHCYRLSASELFPDPVSIPSAPPSTGFCFGFCSRGDIPRAAGEPEMDAWSNSSCDVLALDVGGRLSATRAGYVRLAALLLAPVGIGVLLFALSRLRRRRPTRGPAHVAVGGGYAAVALAPLGVVGHALVADPVWLVYIAGTALVALALVATAVSLVVAVLRRSVNRAWAEPLVASALLTIVVVAFYENASIFGC